MLTKNIEYGRSLRQLSCRAGKFALCAIRIQGKYVDMNKAKLPSWQLSGRTLLL